MTNSDLAFEKARVIISDPRSTFRFAARSILFGLGFRVFEFLASLAEVRNALSISKIDIWITSAEFPDGDVLQMIHDLRHGKCCRDSFMPIIVLSANPTTDVVRRVIDSGADLLLALPITGGKLADAIDTLVHHRRPFVVTSDYIGPDRRQSPREDVQQVPLIDVPNPLQAALTGVAGPHERQQAVDTINEQKVERDADQTTWLVRRIVAHYSGEKRDPEVGRHIERLKVVAAELAGRVALTKYLHQAQLCASLISVATRIGDAEGDPDANDIKLLEQVSRAVRLAFDTVDDSASKAALSIARSIEARAS